MNLEALYTLISNFLIVLDNKENEQCQMSDGEVILAYIVSFYAHYVNYTKDHVLSLSRFSRILKRLKANIIQIFYLMSEMGLSKK